MAKVRFPRQEIERFFSLDEKTCERISLLGTTVESLSEREIELEIPANRPDLLSTHGFLRAFSSFQGKEIGLKKYKIDSSLTSTYHIKVENSVKDVRPFTVCAVVKNLKLGKDKIEEIIALQEKIHLTIGRKRKKCAIGVYPLDKIKFPIRYEARKPNDISFTPLGMTKPMTANEILEKHPTGKEYKELLSQAQKYPIFIDANKSILSMPPIINSHETGQVTPETHDLFIECSGQDKETLNVVLNIIVTALADMDGKIYATSVHDKKEEIYPNLTPKKRKLSLQAANDLLGLSLTEKQVSALLERMGYDYKKPNVLIPAWRADVLHEVDIIEDIAIAYGYDNIQPQMPKIVTTGETTKKSTIHNTLMEILIGLEFIETSSLHLITSEEAEKGKVKKPIRVENARTDYSILRPSLAIPILRTLSSNTNVEYPQKISEIGRVFKDDNEQETGISEEDHLALAVTPGNFTEAKRILNYITSMLGLSYTLTEQDHEYFISGRSGTIIINNENAGVIGEVHPSTLATWKLKMPLAIIEINLEKIYNILIKN